MVAAVTVAGRDKSENLEVIPVPVLVETFGQTPGT